MNPKTPVQAELSDKNRVSFQTLEGGMLPKSHFLKRLRIEKRRVDRSKTPLSIVLFSFQDMKVENNIKTQEFLKSLQQKTRVTDIKGWVDRGVIGLILPDTDRRGVQKYIEKMRNGNGGSTFSVVTGTYPDDVFKKLLAEEPSQPDLFPIDLDESKEPKKIEVALKRGVDIFGSMLALILFPTSPGIKGVITSTRLSYPILGRFSRANIKIFL